MKSHIVAKNPNLMHQIIHDKKNLINLDDTYISDEADK